MKEAETATALLYQVEVQWVSPCTGKIAPPDKMLGLPDRVNDANFPFIGYKGANEFGECREGFLFEDRRKATQLKEYIEWYFAENPQYFVINGDGERVLNDQGEPIVAWKPEVTVTALAKEEAEEIFGL
jgi:hypothetical protein